MKIKCFIIMMLFVLFTSISFAATPKTLNYQGKLINFSTKAPVTSAMLATFLIYDNATSGSPLWQEEQLVSPDANGIISVVLGNTTPIIADFSQQLWLAVECPTGVSNALWPRRQLTATPYALYAVSVESSAPAGGWVDDGSAVRLNNSSEKVGIGTSTPTAKLSVAGNVSSESGNSYFGGNVGIGTTTPLTKLHVIGNASIEGNSYLYGSLNVSGNVNATNVNAYNVSASNAVYGFLMSGDGHKVNISVGPSHNQMWFYDYDTSPQTYIKAFIIDHPAKKGKYLVHATLEGPESAVFYRGIAKLKKGMAQITLPDYFESLTREENRTVTLTPRFKNMDEPVSALAATMVEDSKFSVRAIDKNNPEQEFYWEVKAERKDADRLLVEPNRDDVNVMGTGPYKYYSVKGK